MYSNLGRIGIILPANNTVLEPEVYKMLPEGVTAHFARYLTGKDQFSLEALRSRQGFGEAAETLAVSGVNVVALACMASTISRGRDWEKGIVHEIEKTCRVPVTTAYLATLEAFSALRIKNISIGTPYTPEMHALVKPFIEAGGLVVQKHQGLGVTGLREICNQPAHVAYDLALAVDAPRSEGVCLMATDFPTATILEKAEAKIGKPVVSTNQAIVWQCLKLLGVKKEIHGFGKLLQKVA